MTTKNITKNVKLNSLHLNNGNWNLKYPNLEPLYTKHLAIIEIDGDTFSLEHEEIFKILDLFNEVDCENIKIIKACVK